MDKNKKRPKLSKKDRKTLNMVLEDYQSAWQYTENNYHSTWDTAWKLYNNQRTDKAYQGISDIFVPMTFSTIESMVSSMAGSRPQFDFQPTSSEQSDDVKVLNALMDYYWDANQWQSTIDKWIRSMLVYGTGVMYLWWDFDRPKLEIVPLRDFFVDPTATCEQNARFMGRRYLTTKDELESFEYVDPDTKKVKKLYKNINKIQEGGSPSGDETDKETKEIFLGSTLGAEAANKQVEVIEYWTKDRVIAIANRSVTIRDDENPYREAARLRFEDDDSEEGIMPFVVQRNYQDESLFYGRGEVEPIAGLQESLNDLANQRRDAVTYTLNPMFTLDPQYADWLDTVESLPGAVYPFQAGALQKIEMGGLGAESYNEETIIKNDIRETTAADLTFKGIEQDTNQTATEVSAQIAQANQRLALKISQIENEGYHHLAETVMSMVRIFVDEPMMIRIVGEASGIEWQEFDPSILREGRYEPRVQLRSTVEAKKDRDVMAMKELYAAFAGDPEVNQLQLKRMTLQKAYDLDEDEVDALLNVEPAQAMGDVSGEMDLLSALGEIPPEQFGGIGGIGI